MCSDKPCESSNPYPPVSTSSTYLGGSPIGRGVETRSRVTPGMSCTMLIIFPAIAFSSELLPTFGRPTIAMTGNEDMGVVGWGSWVGVVIVIERSPCIIDNQAVLATNQRAPTSDLQP